MKKQLTWRSCRAIFCCGVFGIGKLTGLFQDRISIWIFIRIWFIQKSETLFFAFDLSTVLFNKHPIMIWWDLMAEVSNDLNTFPYRSIIPTLQSIVPTLILVNCKNFLRVNRWIIEESPWARLRCRSTFGQRHNLHVWFKFLLFKQCQQLKIPPVNVFFNDLPNHWITITKSVEVNRWISHWLKKNSSRWWEHLIRSKVSKKFSSGLSIFWTWNFQWLCISARSKTATVPKKTFVTTLGECTITDVLQQQILKDYGLNWKRKTSIVHLRKQWDWTTTTKQKLLPLVFLDFGGNFSDKPKQCWDMGQQLGFNWVHWIHPTLEVIMTAFGENFKQ